MQTQPIIPVLQRNNHDFHPVVQFDPAADKLIAMDFTEANTELTDDITSDTELFSKYINKKLGTRQARYGIGGYNELRNVYSRSKLFGGSSTQNVNRGTGIEEPRRLHLGTDIWGKELSPIFAFIGGMVHSFAFNDQYGDYGATIILCHQLEAISFYTLYGHLSLPDIKKLSAGQYITRGEVIGHIGNPHENGHWPPHLHFQVIVDIELKQGDYPGVCKNSEKEKYLFNCPDPELILQMKRYLGE